MHPDITVGGKLPDISLPDHLGNPQRLSELAGKNPMAVVLYRGYWWPKCQQELRELVELHKEIKVAYTNLVVISTDPPEVSAAFRAGLGAEFVFLSDHERRLQMLYDLQEVTDPKHNPLIPYSFTVFPDLTIHRIYNGYWFWGRPTLEELRRDFREISIQIRRDWDLQNIRQV